MKRIFYTLIVVALVSALAGCASDGSNTATTESGKVTAAVTAAPENKVEFETEEGIPAAPEDAVALSDFGDGFRVYYTPKVSGTYTIHIFSSDSTIIHSECVDVMPVMISTLYNGETAVGIIYDGTEDGSIRFISTVDGKWSDEFETYYDVMDNRVLFGKGDELIVSDIFDESLYYKVVTDTDVIYGASFTDDGASVEICTVSDDGTETVFETVTLE